MYFLLLGMVTVVVSFVVGHGMGRAEGKQEAFKYAYKTNPPSEKLEDACLGLWMGEQNKKYWAKEKDK